MAVAGVYHKHYLPNYGVFDEDRYFQRRQESRCSSSPARRVGVSICEDIWYPDGSTHLAGLGGRETHHQHQRLALPRRQAGGSRERMLSTRAADTDVIVAYVNLVGGQDELVFDGHSVVFDGSGELDRPRLRPSRRTC